MSSANNLGFELKLPEKSLIQLRKGPRIDPWGTPAEIFDHLEYRQIKTTLCILFLRKSIKIFNKSPVTPFYFNSKMRPLCQIWSNVLEISRKIPLTSKRLSNDWWISCVIVAKSKIGNRRNTARKLKKHRREP